MKMELGTHKPEPVCDRSGEVTYQPVVQRKGPNGLTTSIVLIRNLFCELEAFYLWPDFS